MFKPFDYFSAEKSPSANKRSKENSKLLEEFSRADEKNLLRHIKLAEYAYDNHDKELIKDQKSFCHFLKPKEQRILFESYGLPSKQFSNSKMYWISKSGLNFKDGESKWKSLDSQEKALIGVEYEKVSKEYEKNYFIFSRRLPDNRVSDFLTFIETKSKNLNRSDEIREFQARYGPFELFFEAQKKSNPSLNWNQCRSDFKALDEKKKIYYIKKCEEFFDQYKFGDLDAPVLSQILTQFETRLLMDSYGMPAKPPINVPGYYFKLNYHNYKEDHMKNVYEAYNKLSESEKAQLAAEYQKNIEEYRIKNAEFLKNIPKARLPDVAFLNKRGKSVASKKPSDETDDDSDHESTTKNDLLSDIDELNGFSQQMAEVDQRVAELKVKTKLQTFISENLDYSESSFDQFVLVDLGSREKMNKTESNNYLRSISHKWFKLSDEEKEVYEDLYKRQKKDFKKRVKKFLKENPELNSDLNTIRDQIKKSARLIDVKLENGVKQVLLICDQSLAALVDSSISEIEGGKVKKPKAVMIEDKNLKRKSSKDLACDSLHKKPAL